MLALRQLVTDLEHRKLFLSESTKYWKDFESLEIILHIQYEKFKILNNFYVLQ